MLVCVRFSKYTALPLLLIALPSLPDARAESTTAAVERYSASVDNTGNATSGKRRISLGYQNTNWLGLGHRLTAHIGTTDDPDKNQHISTSYRILLSDPDFSVDLSAGYSELQTVSVDEFGSTEFNGSGRRAAFRINQNIPAQDGYRHRLRYAVEIKDFDNTCTGARSGTCGTISTRPLSLVYNGNRYSGSMQFNTVLSVSANLPGGPHGSEDEFAMARAGAQPDWQVFRFLTSVTHPMDNDLQFRTQLSGQYADDRLVSSEQFSIGGANSVRGYKERSVLGDRGYAVNVELYGPRIKPAIWPDLQLRGLAFIDHGCVGYVDAISTSENSRCLTGVGAGLRALASKQASVRLDVGRAMDSVSSSRSTDRQRKSGDLFGHFSVTLYF